METDIPVNRLHHAIRIPRTKQLPYSNLVNVKSMHNYKHRGHEILEHNGYWICMELSCPDRAVKLPSAFVSRIERAGLQKSKKNRRHYAKIEEWETWDGDDIWIERVWHWTDNPHRRWWQHVLCLPVYILCVIMTIIVAIYLLCTTDWSV